MAKRKRRRNPDGPDVTFFKFYKGPGASWWQAIHRYGTPQEQWGKSFHRKKEAAAYAEQRDLTYHFAEEPKRLKVNPGTRRNPSWDPTRRESQRNLVAWYRGKMHTNYPTVHVMADGGELCDQCMRKERKLILDATMHAPDNAGSDWKQWQYIGTDTHMEGPPIQCDHCYKPIESAYGDPDEGK